MCRINRPRAALHLPWPRLGKLGAEGLENDLGNNPTKGERRVADEGARQGDRHPMKSFRARCMVFAFLAIASEFNHRHKV